MLNKTVVTKTLGKSFAESLDEPFVTFFGEEWSRRQIVDRLHLANMTAVRRLENLFKRLRVKTVEQLSTLDPYSLYRTRGVGATQLFVAMCLLDVHGYDPVSWWDAFDEKSKSKMRKRKQAA